MHPTKTCLILQLLTILALSWLSLAAAAPKSQLASCATAKAGQPASCSLCCATSGFNKFDHKQFMEGRGCRCYLDERELATNSQRKPKRQPSS